MSVCGFTRALTTYTGSATVQRPFAQKYTATATMSVNTESIWPQAALSHIVSGLKAYSAASHSAMPPCAPSRLAQRYSSSAPARSHSIAGSFTVTCERTVLYCTPTSVRSASSAPSTYR